MKTRLFLGLLIITVLLGLLCCDMHGAVEEEGAQQIPFHFTIPGGENIHKVIMHIETVDDEPSLSLDLDIPEDFGSSASRYTGNMNQNSSVIRPAGADCLTDEGLEKSPLPRLMTSTTR